MSAKRDLAAGGPTGAGVPEPAAEETKAPVVRYRNQGYGDTEGRAFIELTPLDPREKTRYRVQVTFRKGPAEQQVFYDLDAGTPDEAFDLYDKQLEEEKKKFEERVGKAVLVAGPNPNIQDFLSKRRGGWPGGNGPGRRIRLP